MKRAEIKTIFQFFQRAFIEADKRNFFRRWESDFNEHKFGHNCRETVSPMRYCGTEVETMDHWDVLEKHSDLLRTSPYGPVCNANGRICSGTSLGRAQQVSLMIIHKLIFVEMFQFFLIPIVMRHCKAKVS